MTSDRDQALRRADARLREGQIDAAIAEYSQLVEAYPSDPTLLNALGDLFVRAGTSQRALPLYRRVADAYLTEGFYARAGGFYKKILKFAPDDEEVLLRLADACAHQGLRADARAYLQTVAGARHRRRDRDGLAAVLCSLDNLDPADVPARLAAVRALVALQPADGIPRLRNIAADLEARDRGSEALAVWDEVHRADPADRTACLKLATAALAAGEPGRALALLDSAAPGESEFTLRLQALRQAGDFAGAGDALVARLLTHPGDRFTLAAEAHRTFDDPGAAPAWVVACARAARAEGDAAGAVTQLLTFARTHAGTVSQSQVTEVLALAARWAREDGLDRLPDASGTGAGTAADGVDHSPAEGRLTPPAPMAGRSGDSGSAEQAVGPVTSSLREHDTSGEPQVLHADLADGASSAAAEQVIEVMPLDEPLEVEPILDDEAEAASGRDATVDRAGWTASGRDGVPGPDAVGWHAAAVPAGAPSAEPADPQPDLVPDAAIARRPRAAHAVVEVEVDLTDRLDAAAAEPPATTADRAGADDGPPAPAAGRDLETTFASMRSEAVQQGADLLALGRTCLAAGLYDQAIEAFTTAAHDPVQRYEASLALAELFEWRRDGPSMVEWLEETAESAPSPASRGAILYRLGMVLEQLGEPARALAVLLELEALAPGFRDVRARVARLGAAQAGGGSSVP